MVLSKLVLNLDDKAARKDLANPYEMHSTLMRLVDAGSSRPLWRLEVDSGRVQAPVVLIQTISVPKGEALLDASETYFNDFKSNENRLYERVEAGDVLNFRLRANPTVTREGKRHGLTDVAEHLAWLGRQVERAGGTLLGASTSQVGKLKMARRDSTKRMVIMGVTFDGSMMVRDADALRAAVRNGIGPAKSFGFGLLSLSR